MKLVRFITPNYFSVYFLYFVIQKFDFKESRFTFSCLYIFFNKALVISFEILIKLKKCYKITLNFVATVCFWDWLNILENNCSSSKLHDDRNWMQSEDIVSLFFSKKSFVSYRTW